MSQATSIRDQPPELVDLPTEVLVEIFNLVPDKDLLTARLICKKLCDAATPRFAMVNFTQSFHVVSPYSINALVDITEHPVFGKYVKTVGIYSARRTNILDGTFEGPGTNEQYDHDLFLNAYVKTRRFARRMERVFRNIKSHSNPVHIGIYDNPGRIDLDEDNLRRLKPSVPMKCYGWAQLFETPSTCIAYRPVETLEQTIYAARRVGCPVKYLNINLIAYYDDNEHAELDAALYKILESTLTTLSLGLGSGKSCQLSYESESQCLNLQAVDFGEDFALPVHASYMWLQTKSIARLRIAKVSDYQPFHLRPFFTPHLSSLELSEMSVWTEHFDQNLWSKHIQIISTLPGLQHCKLSCLVYSFSLVYHAGSRRVSMQLPSYGYYPTKRHRRFYLTFRDGRDLFRINGENVRGKFEELTCYVAAAEAQKVQKIVSAGRVDDFVVGIIDEVEEQITHEQPVLT